MPSHLPANGCASTWTGRLRLEAAVHLVEVAGAVAPPVPAALVDRLTDAEASATVLVDQVDEDDALLTTMPTSIQADHGGDAE